MTTQTPFADAHDRPASKFAGIQETLRREWRMTVSITMFVLGIILLLLGWYGAAYTNIVSEQIPYVISGGLLGLALVVVAGIMASAALRDRESIALRREIARALASAGTMRAPALETGEFPSEPRAGGVFAVPGGRSFHLAGCPIIEGKEGVRALAARDARAHGLEPCKLCTD